jgi:hypothetical protein
MEPWPHSIGQLEWRSILTEASCTLLNRKTTVFDPSICKLFMWAHSLAHAAQPHHGSMESALLLGSRSRVTW